MKQNKELAMLDITATVEGRKTMLEVVRKVADAVTVPFTMGGGISSVAAAEEVLKAGANKVSTSSAVFRRPEMIGEMVKELGADKVTVAIDVAQNAAMPSGYEVFIDGGRTATGKDAIEWAKQVNDYGVACILPTSKHPADFQVHGRRSHGLRPAAHQEDPRDYGRLGGRVRRRGHDGALRRGGGGRRRRPSRGVGVSLPRDRHPGAQGVPRLPRASRPHLIGAGQ